jgi:4'-phosphopantetheinyl transferase
MSAVELSPGVPPDRAPLAGEAQLRVIDLGRAAAIEASLRCFLSADEIERATRFHRSADRSRFVATRGWLRVTLARALATTPERVSFSYGARGKPRLAGAFAEAALSFNVSHSGDYALIGLAAGQAIGVDIEQLRPMPDFESIAAGYFSANETRAIQALAAPDRLRGFFRCWARKEAFMKATGEGMSIALDGFSVVLGEDEESTIRTPDSPDGRATTWTVKGVLPVPGCEAAVSVEVPATRVSAWLDSVSI